MSRRERWTGWLVLLLLFVFWGLVTLAQESPQCADARHAVAAMSKELDKRWADYEAAGSELAWAYRAVYEETARHYKPRMEELQRFIREHCN